eukprot:m.73681 g.73681  ORF g.73681 m.73681 type:complete len:135 (-) comp8426_c0_seq1:611-1015(-)
MGGKSSKVVMAERLERSSKTGVLALQGLGLSQVPPKVFELNKLRSMSLAENKLETLPPELSMLKDLKTLQLNSNLLEDLPSAFSSFSKLEKLFLHQNTYIDACPNKHSCLQCMMMLLYRISLPPSPHAYLRILN